MPTSTLSPEKISLGFFPTPLVRLTRLSEVLDGPAIYMKRDDQTGLALGGNKTRKLEYILGEALVNGCDCVITAGASQSNHCRQTAAAAAKLGLECHLLLGGEEPDTANGNLLLDKILGAHLHWAGKNRKGEYLPGLYRELEKAGKKPFIIPYGGSNELGAIAFVEAFRELIEQSGELDLTHIVFASSSGGTQAGLMVGKTLYNQDCRLVGIHVDKDEPGETPLRQQIISLANRTAGRLDMAYEFAGQDLILEQNYQGEGYGIVGPLEQEAMKLVARTEGILLDPVYTGRAMGGLIDMVRSGKLTHKDNVLFWHTGGTPAIFAKAECLLEPDK